jgi:polyisoprenoid-binding protein YceI
MLSRLLFASLVFGGIAALPFPAQQKGGGGPSGRFTIDPIHSTVIFKIRHVGVSNFYGRFNEVTGMIMVDADDPAESIVKFTIPTAKVDTNDPGRDKHLRGADFFNADEFKTIEFVSTKIEAKGKDAFELTGDLLLHGVTKPVTAHVQQIGFAEKTQMGARVGYEATLKVKRSDFGMKGFIENGALGDEVELIISVEAGK